MEISFHWKHIQFAPFIVIGVANLYCKFNNKNRLCGSYFGLVVDLIGGPLLLFDSTRLFPLIFGCMFHLANFTLFSIGVFPALMLSTMVLYIEPTRIKQVLNLLIKSKISPTPQSSSSSKSTPIQFYLTMTLIILHLVIPLRHFMFSSRPNWTNQIYFNWRMMLNQEDTLVRWLASESFSNENTTIYSFTSDMDMVKLTDYQRQQMKHDPVLLLNFAQIVVKPSMQKLLPNSDIQITIDAWKSVNNR